MHKNKCSEVFWWYGMEDTSEIREILAREVANSRTPLEGTTGDSVDISEYIEFDCYSWIKFHDLHNDGTDNE
jgi:hypothetical protein